MLLHLTNKYRAILGIDLSSLRNKGKIIGMGEEILEHMCPCDEIDGLKLIKMCAEADTNERVHIYLNNNLWAIRGLEAVSELLGAEGEKFSSAAKELRANVEMVTERYSVCGTRFGDLPPFRVGYTATPSTLSRCKDTFFPLSEDKKDEYFSTSWNRSDVLKEEDFIENNYANYRYYLEMLSSMLLPEKYADAIVNMRENLGGELLCMTRFMDWIDDWPVLNYARFLIESGRIEKYLLLLYSHAAHHGEPERMTYYEQVSIDGTVRANDCIPSLLTVPTMLAWCFAYENVNKDKLSLLSAIPKKWYKYGFSAKGIGYSEGKVDIKYADSKLSVCFEKIPTLPVEIVVRSKTEISANDIICGRENIERTDGNVILLKPGVKEFEITIN